MNRIKGYKLFLESGQTEELVKKICEEYGIKNWSINSEGLVDVDGSVDLHNTGLTKLPLKFGTVTINFSCSYNQLTSLEGCPEWVGGYFSCYSNNLTTLEGGPKEVGGDFNGQDNSLVSLKGSPVRVGGNFNCGGNQLTDLVGAPQMAGGYYFNKNRIRSFEGLPEDFEGHVEFYQNPVQKILDSFPEDLWIRAINLINDYDAIWNGEVIPERLEMVKEKLGLI